MLVWPMAFQLVLEPMVTTVTIPRLVLKEGNYRRWSTVIEQMLREKKVWGHDKLCRYPSQF